MQPKIEFSTTPMFGMFADTDFLHEYVFRLQEMSKPSDGNKDLKVWKSLVLAQRWYQGETPIGAVVYSPYLLGKELDLNNWDDCTQLYFPFFEMYVADYRSDPKDMYATFKDHHHHFCSWGITELLEVWESSKQHKNIKNHIKDIHKNAESKKI